MNDPSLEFGTSFSQPAPSNYTRKCLDHSYQYTSPPDKAAAFMRNQSHCGDHTLAYQYCVCYRWHDGKPGESGDDANQGLRLMPRAGWPQSKRENKVPSHTNLRSPPKPTPVPPEMQGYDHEDFSGRYRGEDQVYTQFR